VFMLRCNLVNDFPLIEEVIYLNTASIGLVPIPVLESVKEFIEKTSIRGTVYLSEEVEENIFEDLRVNSANLLGCSVDEVAIFNSVTEALNSIAWALRGGGKIVSTNIEFPTVVYPWMRISKNKDWKVVLIDSKDYLIDEDELLMAIDEDTLSVVISHVEFLTGQRFNLKALAEKAHEVGAILIVDGIQATGCIPVDVKRDDVDIYITGSYKWLIGPFGAAVAYIRHDLCRELEPGLVGWRSVKNMWSLNIRESMDYVDSARKFEYSSSAYEAKVAMSKSIEYLTRIGIDNIYSYNMKLTKYFMEELVNIENIEVVTPVNVKERGSIVTVKVKGLNPTTIKRGLNSKELKNGGRDIEFSIRRGLARFSPHFYNDKEDVDEVIERLRKLFSRYGT